MANNLTTIVLIAIKSGNLKHLESSGPLQACTGIALPLPSLIFVTHYITYTGRDSVVSIANWYGLEGPGIKFWCGTRLSTPVQTSPGVHQPPVWCVTCLS